MINNNLESVTAFAPASSSNLSVGYDVLGVAFDCLGDEVTLTKNNENILRILQIESDKPLPMAVKKNTATFAMQKMLDELSIEQGFDVVIKKGIPLCSGLGGSAASSVAAVYALNHFLVTPLPIEKLAMFALQAEQLSSGTMHADNVVPCLWGELTLITSLTPLEVLTLPRPDIYLILVHPDTEIPTIEARQALSKTIDLNQHIRQSANLAGMIATLYDKGKSFSTFCQDIIIEPQRAHLLPGFYQVKQAALDAGAFSCSFSGAGPTLYALSNSQEQADNISQSMQESFMKHQLKSQSWIRNLNAVEGPRIIKER
jgi:homoserine kinase